MHPNKASGPNGMTLNFFKNFWHIVGPDIVLVIKSFFHYGFLLKSINETIISLIPKVLAPANLTQFRLISLCNILYKVSSMLLVNRLKPILDMCISDNQSALILRR